MKKAIYTIVIFLTALNSVFAQGFLDKMKSKITQAVQSKEPAKVSTSASGSQYTDPAKFGTLLMTYSSKEMSDHMGGSEGGYDLWFSSINVINNQLQFTVVDYATNLGTYTNGQFQKTTGAADKGQQNNIPNGSEIELRSKDFSQIDMTNAMLKKGPSVASGRLPGKADQAFTFNGKALGNYMMANLAHNADSTAVAVMGTGFANGALKYSLATSNGQKVDLPIKITGWPLISPDGKMAAAIVQVMTGAGAADIYLTNGNKVTIGLYDSNVGVWLHNSGAVYYINNSNNKELMKNGTSFLTSDSQLNPKILFINSNDNTACWAASRGIRFSDGTEFENASSPHKVIINNKEVIVFLDIDVPTGKLYLCQHDL